MGILTQYDVHVRLVESRICMCNRCRVRPLEQVDFEFSVEAGSLVLAIREAEKTARYWATWPSWNVPSAIQENAKFELISIKEGDDEWVNPDAQH